MAGTAADPSSSDSRKSRSEDERLDLALAAAFTVESPALRLPAQLGNYRPLRILGSGGMGVVYEAEQRSPRRLVALKVLRSGFADGSLLRRFEREVELLGRLEHPGIAHIYESGTFDDGSGPQPFLAMERIEGERLDRHLASRRPDLAARVGLMVRIAEAVQYAHQKGVIHRDLKPSNVLVDGEGRPKVLDFGIARAIDAGDRGNESETLTGQVLGTLSYMSPEQAAGENDSIDTRTDVYALGAMSYETLCGRLPLDLSGKSFLQAVRMVREVEPAPLSQFSRALAGDLETIVAHALEKDPARRYGSAGELAEDLRRHLANEPILARPPTTRYQLAKFARRHRALVAGAAAVVASLLLGLTVALVYAYDAARSRDRAELESEQKTRTIGVLGDILASSSPFVSGPDARVVDVLDETVQRLDHELAEDPEVEQAVRSAVGRSYRELGLYERARPHLERAAELAVRGHGREHPIALRALAEKAELQMELGGLAEGESLAREVRETRARILGPEHRDTLQSDAALAYALALRGERAAAISAYRELASTCERVLGEADPDTLRALDCLSNLLLDAGEREEAERVARRALELATVVHGPRSGHTLMKAVSLAAALSDLGRTREAMELYERTLAEARETLGPEHSFTGMILASQALALSAAGEEDKAEALHWAALPIYERALGVEHPATLTVKNNLGVCLGRLNRVEEAEGILLEVLSERERVLGPEHADVAASTRALGTLYRRAGRLEEALPMLERSLSIDMVKRGPEDRDVLTDKFTLAQVLVELGRRGEARTLLEEILPLQRAKFGDAHPNVTNTRALLDSVTD